ncbi:MAG: hypothetical protein QME55_06080, partial [Brevundimonas sp.]|nr:hypothetical protein [Brevundimonas sp.]
MRLQRLRGASLAALACVALTACATTGDNGSNGDAASAGDSEARKPLAMGLDAAANPDPFPSTYRGLPRANMAIVGATVFTGAGQRIENGVVVVADGGDPAVLADAGFENAEVQDAHLRDFARTPAVRS